MIGGIPLGTNDAEKKAMNEAVDIRLKKQKKCLVIYPEAHVWPYATKIRKFPAGGKSFKYAVRNDLPVFAMITTYHKSKKKNQERPRIDVYLDGPFYPNKELSGKEAEKELRDRVYNQMVLRSKNNNIEYKYHYEKKEKQDV
jgi:1-acyl-sn-glycerol-3-phosphate acyltransferase